jgi:hypothetical protein
MSVSCSPPRCLESRWQLARSEQFELQITTSNEQSCSYSNMIGIRKVGESVVLLKGGLRNPSIATKDLAVTGECICDPRNTT